MKEQQRDYLYGGAFAKERTRLASIEALWDPGSQSLLDEVGLGAGRRCLEVGAGGGSLVEWMVKRGAAVTAMDIDTRFIEHLASDTVDVRCVDVRTDELPLGKFDPVHARLVLEHLSDRRNILDKLAATLRPRGWIVIEDFEFSCFSVGDEPYLEATVPADAEPFEVAWQIVKVVDAAKGSRPFRTTSIVPDLHRSGRQRRRRRHPRGRTSTSVLLPADRPERSAQGEQLSATERDWLVTTCTTTRLPSLPRPGYGAHCTSHPGFHAEMDRIAAHSVSKSSRCSRINQTALVLVFPSYLVGILTTFPQQDLRTKPWMVSFAAGLAWKPKAKARWGHWVVSRVGPIRSYVDCASPMVYGSAVTMSCTDMASVPVFVGGASVCEDG